MSLFQRYRRKTGPREAETDRSSDTRFNFSNYCSAGHASQSCKHRTHGLHAVHTIRPGTGLHEPDPFPDPLAENRYQMARGAAVHGVTSASRPPLSPAACLPTGTILGLRKIITALHRQRSLPARDSTMSGILLDDFRRTEGLVHCLNTPYCLIVMIWLIKPEGSNIRIQGYQRKLLKHLTMVSP